MTRCPWAISNIEMDYHDTFWGKPVKNDETLFEMLILEGMQAGLSWKTILTKRNDIKKAFDNFNPHIIYKYDQKKIDTLMSNAGIIRNRSKINSVVTNSLAYIKLLESGVSLSDYIWSFVDNKPIINNWKNTNEVPSKTIISEIMSKDMSKKGFKFVGPTILYAFMQACGLVDDHLITCPYHTYNKKL